MIIQAGSFQNTMMTSAFQAQSANSAAMNKADRTSTMASMVNEKVAVDKSVSEEAAIDLIKRMSGNEAIKGCFRSYESILDDAEKFEEGVTEQYKSLMEQKEYYAGLGKDSITKFEENGKFGLAGYVKDDKIDKKQLEKLAQEVQEELDSLMEEVETYYSRQTAAFETTSLELSVARPDVVKKYASTLTPINNYKESQAGNPYFVSGAVRNEENFLDQSSSTLNSIDNLRETLKSIEEEALTPNPDMEPTTVEQAMEILVKLQEMEDYAKFANYAQYEQYGTYDNYVEANTLDVYA